VTLLDYASDMPCTQEEHFELHANVANLVRISPPFPPVSVVSPVKRSEPGDLQLIRCGWSRLGSTWRARVTQVVPDRLVEDVIEAGVFRKWRHQHRFSATPGGSRLTDAVSFRLLPTPLGEFLEYLAVRPLLLAMFALRHRKTRNVLRDNKS
jgi:ligand-binding SRPBCC domain-containing protein